MMLQMQTVDRQHAGLHHLRAAAARPLNILMPVLRLRIADIASAAQIQLGARHSVVWHPNGIPLRDMSASSFSTEREQQPI